MKKLLLSLMLLLLSQTLLLAQITSTTTGGNWNATTTWIGGVIPTATVDAIIDGDVLVNSFNLECNNLTINNGKKLGGGSEIRTLTVNGNLTNTGTVEKNGNLSVIVKGDLFVTGLTSPNTIRLFSTINQNINIYAGWVASSLNFEINSNLIGSSYQWYKDGVVITNSTSSYLAVDYYTSADDGVYKCVVDGSDTRTITVTTGGGTSSGSTLNGRVTNAVDGTPISGALVGIAGLSTTTDADGSYEITNISEAVLNAAFSGTPLTGTAPLEVSFTDQSNDAAHSLEVSATGFSNYTNNQVVIAAGETLTMDVSLSTTLATGEMRIVLNWGNEPADLDSYLKTPSIEGNEYTIYFSNKGNATSAPYVTLDHDDQDYYGPETITIYQKSAGTYKYYVHKYSSSGDLINSNAVVQVYTNDGLITSVNIPTTGTGTYWNVLTIDGSNGNVSVINEIIDNTPTIAPPLMPNKIKNLAQNKILAQGTQVITSWAWSFGDGATSTDQNPAHTYTAAGDYTVTLVASNGTDNATETKTNYISVSEGTSGGAIVSTTTGGLWTQTTTWIGGIVPTVTDDVIIDGIVEVDGGWECKNLTVNSGKVLTCNINVSTIKANGNVINNGTIQNNDWMAFYLEIKGNITNNGVWSNEKIRMVGTTDQTISGSQPYSSADFAMGIGLEGTGQKLIAGSDISFINTLFYFNNSEFMIEEGKEVSFSNVLETDYGRMSKCHFIGGGTIHSDSLFEFSDSTLFMNVTLTGIIQTGGLIIIKENVKLLGVIQSFGNTDRVEFAEDFVNDGTIRDNDWRSLDVTVLKNITNDSFWENYQIEMDGTTDQTFTNNSHLYSQFNFNANVSSATTFQWYKDGVAIDDVYATGEVYYYTKQASFEEYNPYGTYYCHTNAGDSRKITIINGGSGEEDVILTENFDGTVFPPNGWTQAITNSTKTWTKGNPQDNPFTAIDSTNVYSAICPWVAENQDEWLKTPIVVLPNDAILLEFHAGFSTSYLVNATMKLNISTDGGSNWTKIWEAGDDGNGWIWKEISLDLSSYKNSTNVMLGWQYVGNNGDLLGIDNVKLIYGIVDVEENKGTEIPTKYALNQNYPNPFNPSTIISYALPKQGLVSINIYNILGEKIAELINKEQSAGSYQFTFDASNLSTGIYIYRIQTDNFVQSRKMLLLK